MLAQFQSLYPNGSLISELIQIFQGKYIVRASVQIEGVIRATGMAAADTVEAAEDHARNRALMVLAMDSRGGVSPPIEVSPPMGVSDPIEVSPPMGVSDPIEVSPPTSTPIEFSPPTSAPPTFAPSLRVSPPVESSVVSGKEISVPPTQPDELTTDTPISSTRDTYSQNLGQSFGVTSKGEAEFEIPPVKNFGITSSNEADNQNYPEIAPSNVTPFTPRNYTPPEDLPTPISSGKKKKKSEPVDLSDVIAKTDVELQRLGWTAEQGREYLIKTYGKRGRTLLTEEELHGFLKYLESQTTPIDPLTGF